MNERIRKYFISAMAICTAFLLLLPVCVCNVFADGSIEDDLTYIINQPYRFSKFSYNANNPYYRIRFGTNNVNSFVTPDSLTDPATIYGITYTKPNDNYKYVLLFSEFNFLSNSNGYKIQFDYSSDRLSWNNHTNISASAQSYTASWTDSNSVQHTGKKLYYWNSNTSTLNNPTSNYQTHIYELENIPRVSLNQGQSYESILYLFSSEDFSYIPWNFQNSSGGMNFSDGSSLDATNTAKYSQIFLIMDNDDNSSVTEAELFYYNANYNTNYDYSQINNGDDFTELQFLNWVALQIANGDDDPGGGTGSGGGSAIGGGITIGDNSFTQTQTQSIEENAVNVTVNNNNSLSQENVQTLENFIELNLGTEQENAFAEAVGGISRFIGVGQAFAGLVTAVLGFLPAWTITLLGVLFTIIFVMIVFRLLHVFL